MVSQVLPHPSPMKKMYRNVAHRPGCGDTFSIELLLLKWLNLSSWQKSSQHHVVFLPNDSTEFGWEILGRLHLSKLRHFPCYSSQNTVERPLTRHLHCIGSYKQSRDEQANTGERVWRIRVKHLWPSFSTRCPGTNIPYYPEQLNTLSQI